MTHCWLAGWLTAVFCRAHTHVAPGDNKATGVTGRQGCLSTACARPAAGWGPRGGGNVNTGKRVRGKCAETLEEGGVSERALDPSWLCQKGVSGLP